jgi:hypothetical protein
MNPMISNASSSSTSLGLDLADKLQGPFGTNERQFRLDQLLSIEKRLLQQIGGDGAGAAWVADIDGESLKLIHSALSAVRSARDILEQIEFKDSGL